MRRFEARPRPLPRGRLALRLRVLERLTQRLDRRGRAPGGCSAEYMRIVDRVVMGDGEVTRTPRRAAEPGGAAAPAYQRATSPSPPAVLGDPTRFEPDPQP